MTPKEKAIELVDKFREYSHTDFNYYSGVDTEIKNAKQCALIAVDLLISETFPAWTGEPIDAQLRHTQGYYHIDEQTYIKRSAAGFPNENV
jgi:hypothetical protein